MFTKKNLVVAVLTLSLGLGFAAGAAPALANSDESTSNSISVSTVDKQAQSTFTGFVSSIGDTYMTIINAPTKEQALQGEWWEFVNQGKVLLVPVPQNEAYAVGDQLHVYYSAMTMSLPPIAIMPVLEKVAE